MTVFVAALWVFFGEACFPGKRDVGDIGWWDLWLCFGFVGVGAGRGGIMPLLGRAKAEEDI